LALTTSSEGVESEAGHGLTLAMLRSAHERIHANITCTPVMTSKVFDELSGANVHFKCENLQKTGSFKARGAINSVICLSGEEARRGVVTHSSGNFGAALAWAARIRDIPAYVVMPDNAPKAKVASVQRYGGEVVFCAATLEAREKTAEWLIEKSGAIFIHAYNNLAVMAGHGTAGLEFVEQVPDLELMLIPVGGGGLISGMAAAAKARSPLTRLIGVEPQGADDAIRSFKAGHLIPSVRPLTIADGLLTSLGDKTFREIQRHVDDIAVVSEDAIVRAMRFIWEVMKLVVEPSGAVALAAILEGRVDVKGKRAGVILSGGNLDLDLLPWQR
jgi:threonine dehydratase